jgi:diacylglycerol kinase (ATP)
MSKTMLIYNPHAGAKKRPFSRVMTFILEDIRRLLRKYEIPFDESPTKGPGDARILAREAAKAGYGQVIVAGGDGTVGEAANGLVGTKTALGILPLGTFMNVARMLSIPFDLEQAVLILKIGNVRTIDVGEVVSLGEKQVDAVRADEPAYFLESTGIGLEADWQRKFLSWERGNWKAVFQIVRDLRRLYAHPLHVELDGGRSFDTNAHLLMVSNGPYMGAAIPVAPSSKLNDHVFTVRRYRLSKGDLLMHLLRLKTVGHDEGKDVMTYKSEAIRITSDEKRPVDADARIFGKTPVSLVVKPDALRVIAGFPDSPADSSLLGKTYLTP